MALRSPTVDEAKLISFLLEAAGGYVHPDELCKNLKVTVLGDGGMGSLRLFQEGGRIDDARVFGKAVSECEFYDVDGVKVIATLYLDRNSELFELDIWKTNYEPLIKISDSLKVIKS